MGLSVYNRKTVVNNTNRSIRVLGGVIEILKTDTEDVVFSSEDFNFNCSLDHMLNCTLLRRFGDK